MTAKKTALHVVESEPVDLDKMEQEVMAELEHMRPAVTRASIDRECLKAKRAQREAERAGLVEKRALAVARAESFISAIDDEIADLDEALGLYSGVGPRLPQPSDD